MRSGTLRARRAWRAGLLVAAATLAAGCGAHRTDAVPRSIPHHGVVRAPEVASQAVPVSSAARLPRTGTADTLEAHSPELLASRALLAVEPTASHHRLVAEAYVRSGVLDAAFDHYTAALILTPDDAIALAGLARVWRDWGFPMLALTPAHRAVFFAPHSPISHNTLGTVLLKLGRPAEARASFGRALSMAPDASYVLNNLCYLDLLEGFPVRALEQCSRAVDGDPGRPESRNNLALAHAATGDFAAAARLFGQGGDEALASYNMGMALMALRDFSQAAEYFDRSAVLDPSRARAARARAVAALGMAHRSIVARDEVQDVR